MLYFLYKKRDNLTKNKSYKNKKIKQYEGKQLEEIENEEDRPIVEIIKRLDEEYNSKKLKARDIGIQGCNAT